MIVRIGFSSSDWWVSRLIRYATRSKVSHAFLLLEGTSLGDLVLEAEWCGWKLSTKRALLRGTTRIVETVVPKVDLEGAVSDALCWIDERYNYEGLFGMAVPALGRWLGKKWRNPLRNSTSMFCSEAIVYVMQSARYPGSFSLDPQSTSPQDLSDFLGVR